MNERTKIKTVLYDATEDDDKPATPAVPSLLDAAKATHNYYCLNILGEPSKNPVAETLHTAIAAEEAKNMTPNPCPVCGFLRGRCQCEIDPDPDPDRARMNADAARMIQRVAELERENARMEEILKENVATYLEERGHRTDEPMPETEEAP